VKALLIKRVSKATCNRFAEPSFVENVRGGICRPQNLELLLFNAERELWKENQRTMLRILRRAGRERPVQENAYALLDWIEYLLRKEANNDIGMLAKQLVTDPIVFPAIWAAATAVPFAGRYVYRIKNLPAQLEKLGAQVQLPDWCKASLAEIDIPVVEAPSSSEDQETED
jgi:hypothetical protein